MASIEECVERLENSDEAERVLAVVDLGYSNRPEAVSPLINRLQREPSPVVRDTILQSLLRIEAEETIRSSIGLLGSEDVQLRNLAIGVLRGKGQRSVPFLRHVIHEGDRDERRCVLDILNGVDAPGTAGIYDRALMDEDPNVVIAAVENLGVIRALEFRRQVEAFIQSAGHPMLMAACLETLAEIGDRHSLALIRLALPDLAALPPCILLPCIKALATLGTPREFIDLAGLIPKQAESILPDLLSALMTIHQRCIYRRYPTPEPPGNVLQSLLGMAERSESPVCRYRATRVLGFWADHEDVLAFLRAAKADAESSIRQGAIEALLAIDRSKAGEPS